MRLILITYNEALDGELTELLDAAGVAGFTKWTRVLGRGRASGPHLGTHVWPKANHVLMAAVEDDSGKALMDGVRELRARLGRQGVKAFMLPLEEVT